MAEPTGVPWKDDVVSVAKDPRSGKSSWLISRRWGNFFLSLLTQSNATARTVASIALTAQTASIGATALVPSTASGLYYVTIRRRVSTAAGINSGLLVTISSTDDGVACSQATANYVGNVTNAPQSDTFCVQCDASTVLAYSVTYASAGAPAMAFELQITVKQE